MSLAMRNINIVDNSSFKTAEEFDEIIDEQCHKTNK